MCSQVFVSETPDAALQKSIDAQSAADPDMMPYFFLQVWSASV